MFGKKKKKEQEQKQAVLDSFKFVRITVEDEGAGVVHHEGVIKSLSCDLGPCLEELSEESLISGEAKVRLFQAKMLTNTMLSALVYAHRDDPKFNKTLEKFGLKITWEK